MIPDYDRKTHVLAISKQEPSSGRLIIDPKDPMSVDRKLPNEKPMFLDPFVMREIEMEDTENVQLD